MKRVIRNGIWETNSSSMHTVTVRGKYNKPSFFYSGDTISVWLGEYGWSGYPLDDFIEKLKYALSMVLHTEYPEFNHWKEEFVVDQDILEELNGYKLLVNAIREYNKDFKRIIIKRKDGAYYPYGYIDHQSCEDYHSLQEFLDDWNVDAERFLFDENVVVYIDNDN